MLRSRLIEHPIFLTESKTSKYKFMIFCRNPMPSTSNTMINIRYHTSFRWEIRYGCIYKKNTSQDPIRSYSHFDTGLTITKPVGDNYFELSIPPFLGLHQVFNVELLRPYFPPLLDTSDGPRTWTIQNTILIALNRKKLI
jgi:hypothetical protein